MAKGEQTTIEAAGREVKLSNPGKVFFPEAGDTKLDLADYYVEVAEAACLHLRDRPTTMKRFVEGAAGEFFFQKRVPKGAPKWLQTTTVRFRAAAARPSSAQAARRAEAGAAEQAQARLGLAGRAARAEGGRDAELEVATSKITSSPGRPRSTSAPGPSRRWRT
jgi:DNA primase